ncbi:MAG: hypothetical protein H6755_07190 [Candidatus Omnitrophica bacterium]|nr:hypothetical protein [Candidatus Omnitrophota bacterium]MCB9748176.1 hypothetical protein [Candidatus Omnitrophota bacterium]
MPISHLPTMMLVIGYCVYWLELFIISPGKSHTSFLAAGLFIFLCVCILSINISKLKYIQNDIRNFLALEFLSKGIVVTGGVLSLAILIIACKAALLPPHLMQEFDAINYHITIPKQHLLMGAFAHIPWSLADLYFLPVDYALAPYWLVTELPNKFPQFIFLLGLLAVVKGLLKELGRGDLLSKMLMVFAILGTHCIAIQMGLAMLDLVLCYLFLAALDSLLKGRIILCAIEFSFYFWSKSFAPIQIGLIMVLLFVGVYIFRRRGFRRIGLIANEHLNVGLQLQHQVNLKKGIAPFIIMSLLIGGPFVGKSLLYANTPLFPFYPGVVNFSKKIDQNSKAWISLKEKAEQAVATKDQYGSGRGVGEFLKHFWLLAVPEKGVNNRYDYPVGLVYLLCLLPFLRILFNSLKNNEILFLPLLVVLFWLTWWLGSHQSRFLFIPLILMYISVISQKKFQTIFFQLGIILSLSLVLLSVYRAHRGDFNKKAFEVIRSQDKQLLEMAKIYKGEGIVILDDFDVAFANFPVDVRNINSVFVIQRD